MIPMHRYLSITISTALILTLAASCNNNSSTEEEQKGTITDTAVTLPKMMSYQLVNEYPHDPLAFTEGLQFVDGYLYESTGQYGKSDIRKTELKTGKLLLQKKMDNKYFGEGMSLINGKVYQLTYREKTGFVYDAATLKQLQTFTFPNNEGWGMTTDGTNLIYDDGGNVLYFLDPNTFKEVKKVAVTDQYGPVLNINELEYIKGYIYANQWQTDFILKIDPSTGKVLARADLSDLRQKTGIAPISAATNQDSPDVLNGIAYDAANNRIYITGKNWPKLFEIKLDN